MLQIGDKAPIGIEVFDENGEKTKLSQHLGKKVVLFFYPQDDTPTCTKEACNLRDYYSVLQEKGLTVLGCSPDSPQSHQKFIKKFNLPYSLLADTEKKLAEAFGVWGERLLFGKMVTGIIRTTFVIDENGVIENVIEKVKSAEHSDQILKGVSLKHLHPE